MNVLLMLCAAAMAALILGAFAWIYRAWYRQGVLGDAAYHLCIIRDLKAHPFTPYAGVRNFLHGAGRDTYPIFFHRLAARLPARGLEKYPAALNAALYALFAGLIALVLTSGFELGLGQALQALLLYFLLSTNLNYAGDGVLYLSLSERMLARLVTSMYFLALVGFMQAEKVALLGLAAVCAGIGLMSAKFSRQALAFVGTLFALLSADPSPVLALAIGAGIAVSAERGFFVRGLRDHLTFLQTYARHTKHGRLFKSAFDRFVNPLWLLDPRVPLRRKLSALPRKEPTHLLFRMPEVIVLLVFLGPLNHTFEYDLLLATAIVYVLVSLPLFNHLGESTRYFEYCLSMVAPLSLSHIWREHPYGFLVVFATIAWNLLLARRAYGAWAAQALPSRDELADFLEDCGLEQDARLLCIPINLAPAVVARTGLPAVCYPGNYGDWFFEDYVAEYPFLKRDWRPIADRHGITHVVSDRRGLANAATFMGWSYDFQGTELVADNGTYVCHRIAKATQD